MLVRGKSADKALKMRGVWLYRLPTAVVVAGGMGADRATLAVRAALDSADAKTLISVGLAGSCDPKIRAGALIRARVVVDTKSGERCDTDDTEESAILASSDQIASAREKRRLHATYGAAMVDMEAATVARLARAQGLNFRAIKGISDAHDFEIESLARFADANGHFQTARFAAHTALRPHTWKAAMVLGRHSNAALKSLNEALLAVINKD